ncbi:DoxX family protein [Jiangella asiatica]|nr:DoxX family protein [Jiangella asiatica]
MIARPMLATIFIAQGAKNLRDPEPALPAATQFSEQFGPMLQKRVPSLPSDPATLVRINAGVQLGAGLALATGRFPRLASVVLLGSLLPTTLAGHPYWRTDDPAQRSAQRVQAMKNVGMAGGLLLAAVDTEGKPGLSWRTRRAAKDARRATRTAKREARMTARRAKSGLSHRISS